jgi:tetratricopeptide (TPR) repeat protein
MRRDQLLFLLVGIGLGAVLGAVLGVVAVRPELVGAASGEAAPPRQSPGQAAQSAGPRIPRVQELREALSRNPKDPDALATLGESMIEANLVQQGLDHFRRALEHNPEHAVLHFRAARAFRAAGQRERALSLAERGMELDQESWEAAEAVFEHAFFGAGDLEAAERALEELERRNPDYPRLAELRDRLARVRESVRKARSGAPDFEAQVRAGNFFYDTQSWAEAESCYRRALEIDPKRPEVVTDLGTAVGRQGRADEAFELFEQALRIDAEYWKAAHNATVIGLRAGDADAASRWLGKLKELRPDHPSIGPLEQRVSALERRS